MADETPPLSDERLAEIRKLRAAVTTEWEAVDDDAVWDSSGWVAETVVRPQVNQFVAASPHIVDELLAEVDRLRAREAAAREVVEAVATMNWTEYCPWDRRHGTMHEVSHDEDCPVTRARALTGLSPADDDEE